MSWSQLRELHTRPDAKTGLDGVKRAQTEEDKLNRLVSDTLETKAGKSLMAYLKSITINRIGGPAMDDNALRHLEGQRYIVGLLEMRLQLGIKGNHD
jgi:hypothetical protein